MGADVECASAPHWDHAKGSPGEGESVVTHCASAKRLAALGLTQASKRHFSRLTSFGLASSFCSVLVGIVPLYGQSLQNGGPAVMFWGWLTVSLLMLVTVCCLAEMASAFPTAGTMYDWANRVAGRSWGPFASWLTGWSIFLGYISSIGAATYSAACEIGQIATLLGADEPSRGGTLGIFAALLFLGAIVNIFSETFLTASSHLSLAVHILGSAFLVLFLVSSAVQGGGLKSASFVLTDFENSSGFSGQSMSAYVVLIGLLSPASTFTGVDTAASVAEETVDSSSSTPLSMIMAVINGTVLGACIIVGLNMSIQDLPSLLRADNSLDAFTMLVRQNTTAAAAVGMHFVLCTAMQCAANSTFTSASRFVYSFARAGALPFADFWSVMDTRTNSPVRAIWLASCLTLLVAVVGQSSNILQIFFAVSTVTYFFSYLVPLLARITVGFDLEFDGEDAGSFTLGKWSRPLCAVASVYCLFMAVIMSLPLSPGVVNWAGPTQAALLVLATASWHLSAKHWYLKTPAAATAVKRRLPVMDSMTTIETDFSDESSAQADAASGLSRSYPSLEDLPAAFVSLVFTTPTSLSELDDDDDGGGGGGGASLASFPAPLPALPPPPMSMLELQDEC